MSEDLVHTQLQEEIQKLADVPKIMNLLKSRGHLQFLHSRLSGILASELEADPELAGSVKDSLKVIMMTMIDQIWGALSSKGSPLPSPAIQLQQCQPDYVNSDATTLELPQGLMDKVEERRNSLKGGKQNTKQFKSAASFSSRSRRSPQSLRKLLTYHLKGITKDSSRKAYA